MLPLRVPAAGHADRASPITVIFGRTSRRAAAALLVLAAACDTAGRPGAPEVRIDTIGGVVHVRNPPPAATDSPEPLLRIGATTAGGTPRPDEFGRISSVTADAEGNVYVADMLGYDIRVFDTAGGHLRTLGRAGAGPGEFGTLQSLTWLGDTLVAMDAGNARLSLLTPTGEEVTTRPWGRITGSTDWVRFHPTGPRTFATLGIRRDAGPGTFTFVRHDVDGARDTITVSADARAVPGPMLTCPIANGIRFFELPFHPRRLVAPAPDNRVAVAWSADYRIGFITDAGDTLRIVQVEHAPVAVPDSAWESGIASWREFREEVPGVRCDGPPVAKPERKPALLGIFFDYDGRLFTEAQTADGSAFDFFDVEGRLAQRIAAPERDRGVVPFVRDGVLYLVVRGELDVQSVVAYPLRMR